MLSGNGRPAPELADMKNTGVTVEPLVSHRGRVFMLLLALQFGLQPLLQKACIDKDRVDRISLIIATEITKMVLCTLAIVCSGPKVYRPILESWTLRESMQAAAFPAAAYALQNWLMQAGYMNLDSLTFNLLNQTKTLFAALCLYLVMGKRQSPLQLVALSLVLAAALLLNTGVRGTAVDTSGATGSGQDTTGGENASSKGRNAQPPAVAEDAIDNTVFWFGVVPVIAASFLSGLSGAVTQRTLQRNGRNSFQLSLELAVYGVMILLLTSVLGFGGSSAKEVDGGSGGGDSIWQKGFFRGWTPLTCVPVLSQAAGGLIVGQVTKHAGSVQKGFSLIAGILVTAAVQSTLENSALTVTHWTAAALVAGGTYLHAKYPYRPSPLVSDKDKTM